MQVPSTGHRKKPDPQERGAGTKERGAYAGGHLPHSSSSAWREPAPAPARHSWQ